MHTCGSLSDGCWWSLSDKCPGHYPHSSCSEKQRTWVCKSAEPSAFVTFTFIFISLFWKDIFKLNFVVLLTDLFMLKHKHKILNASFLVFFPPKISWKKYDKNFGGNKQNLVWELKWLNYYSQYQPENSAMFNLCLKCDLKKEEQKTWKEKNKFLAGTWLDSHWSRKNGSSLSPKYVTISQMSLISSLWS